MASLFRALSCVAVLVAVGVSLPSRAGDQAPATGTLTIIHSNNAKSIRVRPRPPAKRPEPSAGTPSRGKRKRLIVFDAGPSPLQPDISATLSAKLGAEGLVVESRSFAKYLEDSLVDTARFEVLDAPPPRGPKRVGIDTMIPAARRMASDYLVACEIQHLNLDLVEKKIPYIPDVRTYYSANLSVNVRLVEVATSRIVASNIQEHRASVKGRGDSARQSIRLVLGRLYDAAGSAEAAKIADFAYPIKVIDVGQDGLITLNRGRGSLGKGDRLSVVRPGRKLVDPDTGDLLGFTEQAIGRAEVTEVKERVSLARMLDPDAAVKRLDVCRRVTDPAARP